MESHNQKHPPCENHPDGRPVSTCPGCGKTVCSECIKAFGYFCSEACRDAARAAEPEPEEETINYVEAQQRYDTIARILFRRVPLALGALIILVVLIRWIDPTGDEQWRIELPDSAGIAQMIEVKDTLFVLDGNGRVAALDTDNGEEQWNVPAQDHLSSMTHINNALILAGGNQLRCLGAGDGNQRWKLELDENVYDVLWEANPDSVVAGTTRYTSTSPDDEDATWVMNSEVVLLDAATGEVQWRRAIDSQTVHQVGFFAGQPWCLTSESETFQLEALNPEDGRRAWGMRTAGDEPPTILTTGSRMVVVLPEEVMGLGTDGTKQWAEPLSGRITLATQAVDEVILCLDRKSLRSLDVNSGKTQWSIEVPGWVEDASVGDRMLYVSVAGWMKEGEAPKGPLESMPDGPEKQLLEELFFDDEETEDGDDASFFAEVDRLAVYDLRKGRLQWEARMDTSSAVRGSGCCYLLQYVTGMGSLMGGDTSGRLSARAARDGDVLWRFRSDAELTSLVEGDRQVYLETTTILPEMLSKYSRGRPPQIGLAAVRKNGFLHRLTHW